MEEGETDRVYKRAAGGFLVVMATVHLTKIMDTGGYICSTTP
jgi:hypothetical protein